MGSTVFATVTTPGPPGVQGPPGYSPLYIVASGAPGAGIGNNGDMYIDSSNGNVYGPKTAGAWGGIVCNIKGPAGATGTPGAPGYSPLYIVGSGVPTSGIGNNGDMYIDSATSNVYGPKTAGTWGSVQCNIKGATGPQGIQGPPGSAANPRGAWSAVVTYAQADEVTYNSALYISLQGSNLNNVPSSSPTFWESLGAGVGQTPWLSNIDGSNFFLGGVGRIGIANSGGVLPDANASNPALIVGVTAAGSTAGEITVCGNAASGSVGVLNFANYANAATDKRIALILGQTDGAANSGALSFFTYSAGNLAEKMRITAAGLVGIGAVPPAYPLDVRSVAPNYTVLHLNGNTGNDSGLYFISIGGSSGIVGCGAAYSGSGWIAKVASPCTFGDNSVNLFQVNCDSGLTVGATYSPTPRLSIDKTTGYVGIGTTTPGAMLEVRGSYAAGRGHINVIDSAPFAAGVGGHIALMGEYQTGSNVPFGIIAGYKESATSGDFKGGIIFQTLPGSGTMTEGMRITPVGNVGIGTATPSDTLMVRPPGGQAGITIRNQTNTTSNESTLTMLHASNGYGWRVRARDSDGGVQLDVQNNSTWMNGVLTVSSSNGYVGMGGAPVPSAQLMVVGPAGSSSLSSDTSVCLLQTSSATQLAIGGEAGSPYSFWIQTKYAGNNGASWPLALNPSGGSVGIGVLHPGPAVSGALHVYQKGSLFGNSLGTITAPAATDANVLVAYQNATNWAGIGCDVNGSMWFRTGLSGSPDPRLVVSNGGGVGVNMTNPVYSFQVGSDSCAKPGSNVWTVSSDLRVKRDIEPFTEGLETILKLRPIAFAYNGEDQTPEGYRSVGLIAQEVAEIVPSFIRRAPGKIGGEETEVLGLNTGDLTWMIVNALREINERLTRLEKL